MQIILYYYSVKKMNFSALYMYVLGEKSIICFLLNRIYVTWLTEGSQHCYAVKNVELMREAIITVSQTAFGEEF